MAGSGLVRSLHAIAIELAWGEARDVTVPNFVCVFGKRNPPRLAAIRRIEQAKLHARRIGREEREVHAPTVRGRAKRPWRARLKSLLHCTYGPSRSRTSVARGGSVRLSE